MTRLLQKRLPELKIPVISEIIEFRDIYDESGISTLYHDYTRRMMISIGAVFILTIAVSTLYHSLILHLPMVKVLVSGVSLAMSTTNLTALVFLLYPMYQRNQNRSKIEGGLIYTIGYMKILSAGGYSIEHIMERVAEVEDDLRTRQLARKFVMDIKLMGFDVSTALEDIVSRASSDILKRLIGSVNHSIKTSGDLKAIFGYEMERQLNRKMEDLKGLIRSLGYLGEIYVAVFVVGPTLFILMITILSIFSGASSSSVLQLNLIVFFGVPVIAAAFLIILDTVVEGDY